MIGKEVVVIHTGWERDIFGHFCGLSNIHVLSVFKCDYQVILFFVLIHCGHREASSDVGVLGNSFIFNQNIT